MPITHKKVSVIADSADESLIQPSDWNDVHEGGYESPITTEGDLIIGGADGVELRLPKGSIGKILVMGANQPEWLYLSSMVTEDKTDEVDGEKTEFTMSDYFVSGSVKVYFNGIRQRAINYTENILTKSVVLNFVPILGDEIIFDYYLNI